MNTPYRYAAKRVNARFFVRKARRNHSFDARASKSRTKTGLPISNSDCCQAFSATIALVAKIISIFLKKDCTGISRAWRGDAGGGGDFEGIWPVSICMGSKSCAIVLFFAAHALGFSLATQTIQVLEVTGFFVGGARRSAGMRRIELW